MEGLRSGRGRGPLLLHHTLAAGSPSGATRGARATRDRVLVARGIVALKHKLPESDVRDLLAKVELLVLHMCLCRIYKVCCYTHVF